MVEGWYGNDYIILFADEEAPAVESAYELNAMLPGYSIVGLHGWHDFIVKDEVGATFTIPSVPLDTKYLVSFSLPVSSDLQPDARLIGTVKWLNQPLIFGGSPEAGDIVSWVTHRRHGELVRWWNARYSSDKASKV